MPVVSFSKCCYIKNDLYRLSIIVDNNEQSSVNVSFESNSEFNVFPIDSIEPSLTRINFQLINGKENTNIPKTIPLNHLLNVELIERSMNKYPESPDKILNRNERIKPISRQSSRSNIKSMRRQISEVIVSKTPVLREKSHFRQFFSTQSYNTSQTNVFTQPLISISYVDMSNSVRWNVNKIIIDLKDEDISNELYVNLDQCLLTLKQRPRHLLAFVNPVGGKGRAKFVYEEKVLPIFKQANIQVHSIYTKHAGHARDYILNEDLSNYDGLICVGGDGIFAELCHGLLLRTSREAELNINDPKVQLIRPDLRIGIIPAGSTDAVVFNTTGLNDPVTSALQIILGESLSIDIATVHNEKGFVRFMAAMLAYGFFADIIQKSDKWRRLGPARYDVAGFWHFLRHRSYHSELTITLSPHDSSQICPSTESNVNGMGGESLGTCDSSQLSKHTNQENDVKVDDNIQADNLLKYSDKINTLTTEFCSRNCETCALEGVKNPPKHHTPLKIKCHSKYTTINCLNMPGRCAKSKLGMAPYVHLGDGSFDLVLVKCSSHKDFLRFLWQVANDGRSIEDLPNVERYRASEVHVRSINADRISSENWACDGELISGNEIQVRIHRQVLNLFASGIHSNELIHDKSMRKTSS